MSSSCSLFSIFGKKNLMQPFDRVGKIKFGWVSLYILINHHKQMPKPCLEILSKKLLLLILLPFVPGLILRKIFSSLVVFNLFFLTTLRCQLIFEINFWDKQYSDRPWFYLKGRGNQPCGSVCILNPLWLYICFPFFKLSTKQ